MSNGYTKPRPIPENVTDSGRILNGLFKTRNLVEGLILAALPTYLVYRYVHIDDIAYKILFLILAFAIPLGISLVFPYNYTPFEFLWIWIQYRRKKHYAKYNPRLKWETIPDYLINANRISPLEWFQSFILTISGNRKPDGPGIDTNIVAPTHDEQFIEDRDYLRERDLVPQELKSAAQIRKEKWEQRKFERAIKKQQDEQIQAIKKKEKAERKAARKESFLTEQEGETHAEL